jgi:hypothetical protein
MTVAKAIKHMDIKEFHEQGFLQEANRQFFHPLGLALEVRVTEGTDGTDGKKLGGIWDYRDDPEGMLFGQDVDPVKAANVKKLHDEKAKVRMERYGFVVQSASERVEPLRFSKPTDVLLASYAKDFGPLTFENYDTDHASAIAIYCLMRELLHSSDFKTTLTDMIDRIEAIPPEHISVIDNEMYNWIQTLMAVEDGDYR